MINAYHSLIKSEEEDFEEYLRKLYLIDIFKPLLEEFSDKGLFKGVVKFILWGYSMESDMLMTQGNTWANVSEEIYQKAELPDDRNIEENELEEKSIYRMVCKLKSFAVRETIERWLNFQNNDNWTQFCHFRDLRKQFLELSLSYLKKSGGEIDIEAKMKAATYSKDLLRMMEDARDGFIQNHPKLRSGVEAVNKATGDKKSRSVGSYAI
jgi:hypothetical protein